jgi:thiosulfate dehydrogenase [quinone] large subunit
MATTLTRTDRSLDAFAGLRIAVGLLFLLFGEYKVFGHAFVHGGFEGWIKQFVDGGAAYPFMIPVLQHVVLPHALLISLLVAYGEFAIGVALVFGVWSRVASAFGTLYMMTLLVSSNYPGANAPFWQYFGASLDHLVLAMCFVTFVVACPDDRLSVTRYLRPRT